MRNASKNELTGLTKQRAEGTIKKYSMAIALSALVDED